MEDYTFKLTTIIRIQAFSEQDAAEAIEETFGEGNDGGFEVVESILERIE